MRYFEIRGKEKRKCVYWHREISVNSRKAGNLATKRKKTSISYKKTTNESTVLPSTFYSRPSTKTYTLFHTTTSLWVEFSVSTLYFYDSSPTVFSRFEDGSGWKSGSLSSNSLPEADDLSRQKTIFILTVCLWLCCCLVLCFAGRNIFPRIVMFVWCYFCCPLS